MVNSNLTLPQWAQALTASGVITKMGQQLSEGISEEVDKRLEQYLPDLTPVKSGQLKASWKIEKKSDGTHHKNTAPHAIVINRGRAMNLAGTKMLGSASAPKGITQPAADKISAESDAIVSAALSKIVV